MRVRVVVAITGGLLTLLAVGEARAQLQYGRIPVVELGLGGGLTSVPLHDTGTSYGKDDLSGTLGLSLRAHLDLKRALVFADGYLAGGVVGDVGWMARAGLVLGWRTHANLTEFVSSRKNYDGSTTETYRSHLGKKLPVVFGLFGGASVFDLGEASADYGEGSRDAAVVKAGDLGLAAVSAQFELLAGLKLDADSGGLGAYWSFKYALPIGSRTLFFRMSGDHFFGDDEKRLGMLLLGSLGVSSSLGVSTR